MFFKVINNLLLKVSCLFSWMIFFHPQDSMRYLIQDSLVNFTQMVLDASHSTLKLPEDFTWGTDLISSTYK